MGNRFLTAIAIVAAMLAAGCSSTSPAPGTGPAVSPTPPAQTFRHEAELPTESPQASPVPSSTGVDACTLITQAEAETILAVTLAPPEPATAGAGELPNTCHFADGSGDRLATLVVLSLGDASGTYATIASDTEHIDRTISDLGGAAVCSTKVLGTVTLYVLLGPRLVEVITSDCDLAVAIARLAIARL
jgi:hypothetical protein